MEARVYVSIEYEIQSIEICVIELGRHNCIQVYLSFAHINNMHLVNV
jgi:hypothetical protein